MKLPPKELEIEQRIIASILLNADDRQLVFEHLNIDHFYSTIHKVVFEKCREMQTNGSPIDLITVWANLSDEQRKIVETQHKLASLIDAPVATDIKYHISILKDQAARRLAYEQANAILKDCNKKSDLNEIKRKARLIIDQVDSAIDQTDRSAFEFIHNAQILEILKPVEWQIRDVMGNNSFYYDYGDPGNFKTFIALDRLLCIAAGIDYHGHPVKQGTVFYIAGEGQQGIGRRIAAWHIHHKTKAADVPFFVAKTPTQLMDLDSIDRVKKAVDAMTAEYGQPAIVHIDTLARNFGDGDENSTKDMNRAISNLDSAFGTDIGRGLTHHTGHMNKDRARGSIVLHGAADAAFRIRRLDDGKILAESKKMKDAPPAAPMLFSLKEIKLLIGDQHDSTFILELDSEGSDVCILGDMDRKKISENMQAALDILNQMYAACEKNLAADGRSGTMPHISRNEWRAACMQAEIYKRTDGFEKAIIRMFDRGFLQFDESKYYVYPTEIYKKYNSDDFDLA